MAAPQPDPTRYKLLLVAQAGEFFIGDHDSLNAACLAASKYDGSILTWAEWDQFAQATGKRGRYEVFTPDEPS